ncbi:efflux RND transporter periplasmic adaptor subunit [Shimia aestuarii]|uniref:Membrane fusion protein, multidrug efflux system n=1 Tax=Shimia aestuarii TaxID=254406 RepID=A0A1I4N913_9RHOB|nr:efflux RND transporter periplasmic adaptor subunit [Shimia aestuarii]SFM11797.1 membrane fusion protein, multidrug efflux system [Shimia aestuarii]
MRLIPALTAILVTVFLFLIVVERDHLLAFASGGGTKDAATTTQDGDTGADPATLAAQENVVRVVAIHSKAQMIDSAVVLRGQTEADRQVEMRAETSAQIVSNPLRRGAHVKEGQELCRLDRGTREAVLAEAKARLAEANARVPSAQAAQIEASARLEEALINDNAARKLSEGGYASETRVASARAAVRSAEAAVQSAKANLESTLAGIESAQALVAAAEREMERLSITAPFDGLLESDTAELGSLMQAGSVCATVIRLDPIKVVGFVPETEVNRVKLGALAGARLTTGQQVAGQVTFLSRSADPLTRTFRVEVDVPNPDLNIRDGQTAEILIASDGANAHRIPQSALTLNDHGTLGVRLVGAENIVAFNAVTLLRDAPEGVWVEGLPDEADIIIIGQEYVEEGVRVLPVFEEPA